MTKGIHTCRRISSDPERTVKVSQQLAGRGRLGGTDCHGVPLGTLLRRIKTSSPRRDPDAIESTSSTIAQGQPRYLQMRVRNVAQDALYNGQGWLRPNDHMHTFCIATLASGILSTLYQYSQYIKPSTDVRTPARLILKKLLFRSCTP